MAQMSSSDICPRCDGDKVVVKGPVVAGLAMTATCPRCCGTGKIEIEKKGGHFGKPEMEK